MYSELERGAEWQHVGSAVWMLLYQVSATLQLRRTTLTVAVAHRFRHARDRFRPRLAASDILCLGQVVRHK